METKQIQNGSSGTQLEVNGSLKIGHRHVIDMRSDTITKPTPAMLEAMTTAEVGDNVYGEDPTVRELERRCAEMFGMEASLYVPTGTMANLIAVLVHCQQRGLELITGHKSHILLNEQGGISQFAGVMARTIENLPDGTFDLDELKTLIRPLNDAHQPWTKLIAVETTHNFCGGKAIPIEFLKQVREIAKENSLLVHLDGARVLNASVALGVPVSDIAQYADSVCMCFSKGLSAPVGSILAGTKDFIFMAHRMRKSLGGGMRQSGIIAASALWALDNMLPQLSKDHQHAKLISDEILSVAKGVVDVNTDGITTNMVMIEMVKPGLKAATFCKRMQEVTEEEVEAIGQPITVKLLAIYPLGARIVTNRHISREDVDLVLLKIKYVIEEFRQH